MQVILKGRLDLIQLVTAEKASLNYNTTVFGGEVLPSTHTEHSTDRCATARLVLIFKDKNQGSLPMINVRLMLVYVLKDSIAESVKKLTESFGCGFSCFCTLPT